MPKYETKVWFTVSYETDGAPNDKMNEFLDLLSEVNTDVLGLHWDNVDWTTEGGEDE